MDKDKGEIPWSNEKWTRGNERTSPLDQVSQISLGEEKERGREQTERDGGREGFRERLHLLSKIPGDRTVGFRRGKEQSCSPRQGLHVGTSFGEFPQTPGKVGVFLLLDLLLA